MNSPNTIEEARIMLAKGEITPEDLVKSSLKKIKKWEPIINSLIEVWSESASLNARNQAKEKHQGKLAGIPVAIKDLILTKEGHTTAASKMLENFTAPYEATVVRKLKEEGAIIVGKANLDEYAMGASNEYSAYNPVANPWDISRVAGGSSGGSAASVATGEVFASLGTDTGGSIRLPASFCGVVGLKPTYGRVSRFGVIAYASSFDQVGPITRTVKDNATIFEIIAGLDEYDATTSPAPVGKYLDSCGKSIKGLTIGLPKQFFDENISAEVKEIVSKATSELEKQGSILKKISLPLTSAAIPTYYILVKSEASSNLARYDGLRYGALNVKAKDLIEHYENSRGDHFGTEVKRSILMGTYTLSAGYFDAWYKKASKVRTKIRKEFEDVFKTVDVIAGPVGIETAFKIGEKSDDPLAMYLADLLTDAASVAGLPAMSVPCGFDSKNLPVGLQLIAPHFKEELLYQTGFAYEMSQNWSSKAPKLPNS